MARAVFALIVGVPLTFALIFSAFALSGNDGSYRGAETYWTMKVISGALALADWWAVFKVVRMAREISRSLRG